MFQLINTILSLNNHPYTFSAHTYTKQRYKKNNLSDVEKFSVVYNLRLNIINYNLRYSSIETILYFTFICRVMLALIDKSA